MNAPPRTPETGGLRRPTSALVALVVLSATVTLAADPFYAARYDAGRRALARGDHAEAERALRVACFGFLDEPERLAEGLVHLGLAQAALGRDEALAATVDRIDEIERRFGAYGGAALSETLRDAFEDRLRERLPAATLAVSSTFAHLTAPSEPQPSNGAAAVDDPIGELRRRAREATDRETLLELFEDAHRLAETLVYAPEAWFTAAEIAYRTSLFGEAVSLFERGGGPTAEQPELLFYLAVSLWETGRSEEAAAALEKALPGLRRTPFVERYETSILGGRAE